MSTVNAGISDEVLRLVQTVERLDNDDQERILRMVSLLAMVPAKVRDETQIKLRKLLESESGTMLECIAAVDAVIEYLEISATPSDSALESWSALDYPLVSTRRN